MLKIIKNAKKSPRHDLDESLNYFCSLMALTETLRNLSKFWVWNSWMWKQLNKPFWASFCLLLLPIRIFQRKIIILSSVFIVLTQVKLTKISHLRLPPVIFERMGKSAAAAEQFCVIKNFVENFYFQQTKPF